MVTQLAQAYESPALPGTVAASTEASRASLSEEQEAVLASLSDWESVALSIQHGRGRCTGCECCLPKLNAGSHGKS